jgi:hypothetical protein
LKAPVPPDEIPPQVAANPLSWHCEEFVHPPHWPLTHKSGAQSVFDVQAFVHDPGVSPLQVCAPPQFSFDAHPQTPAVQTAFPDTAVLGDNRR